MAYVVLARKYRPQTLAEVIGQDAVVKTLRNAIKLQRLHHAYLFTGARGVGKTSIARILAKSLNCETGPTDEPCGQCSSCTEIAKSSSNDVLEIDGASNTSVDNVRELRETVRYAAQRGRHKVYIIDEVHMLSTSAFNALLKTLEEPPPHVLFVFATTEPHKIPITILSRTQRFDFRRVPTPILAERVRYVVEQEGLKFDEAAILTVAQAADGSVRDAMSLLDQVIAFAGDNIDATSARSALGLLDRQKVRALLEAMLLRDRLKVSTLVLEAYQSASDFGELGERLVEAVRDLTLVKISDGGAPTLVGLTQDEAKDLSVLAAGLSEPDLHRLFNVVMRTVEDTARSPYPHLSFEMGLMRACDLEPVQNLAALVRELRAGTTTTITAPSAGRIAVAPVAPAALTREPASLGSVPLPQAGEAKARAPVAQSEVRAPVAQSDTRAPVAQSNTRAPVAQSDTRAPSVPPRPLAGEGRVERSDTQGEGSSSPSRPAPIPNVAQNSAQAPTAPLTPPANYREFVQRIGAIKPRLGAALEHCSCSAFSADGIQLVISPGQDVFTDILHEPETLHFVALQTTKYWQRAVPFSVTNAIATEPAQQTLYQAKREEARNEVAREKADTTSHPAVTRVLDILGGKVGAVHVAPALKESMEDLE